MAKHGGDAGCLLKRPPIGRIEMGRHPALVRRPRELVQLARDWRGGLPDGGAMVEEKKDGVRAAWIGGRLLTREGIELGGVDHIAWRLRSIERACGHPLFFDGEFIAPGGYAATLRHVGQGLRAPEQGTLWLFDCLDASEWERDDCGRPLHERKAMLARLVGMMDDPSLSWEWRPGTHGREPDGPGVAIIPDRWCASQDEVEGMAREIWSRGGEGVMIKDAESLYRRRRSGDWLKYKQAGWSTRPLA